MVFREQLETGFAREFGRCIQMAQRVNVVLVDDIDGSDAEETVSFGLDGVDYEIDLSDKHAGELRKALSLYVGHARRTGGRRRNGRRSSTPAAAAADGSPSAADVRSWARENGWDVPERGRVSAEVREAYAAAH
jgi:hypothetical protein